ncbi:MAG: hypothetical protein WAO52_09165 [Prolixibacteraceae bacterium]
MTPKLTSITAQYRSFVDDQVLTANQLNNVVHYFEDQDRLSRLYLSGVGIACGFKVNFAANKITVSQGCGVTTDGDLIQLQISGEDPNERDVSVQSVTYTHFKEFKDSNALYTPFLNDGIQVPLVELVAEDQDKTDSFLLSTLDGLNEMVVLIYQEEFTKPPELCTAIDCNNQGTEEVSRIKVLLISEETAQNLVDSDPLFTKHSIQQIYLILPELAVPRVLLTNNTALSLSNLQKSFQAAISANNIRIQLKTGIGSILKNFKDFLNLPAEITSGNTDQLIDQLLGFSASNIPADFQYRYDLLKDLVDTYNEIKELLLILDSECCPDINSFPKHLMLGKLIETNQFSEFRHSFYRSPAAGNEQKNISKLNSLVHRFYLMLSGYKTSGNEVKITPSKTLVSLSNRSIPYYYTADAKLINNWDFAKTQQMKQKNNLSYTTSALSPADHIQNPLNYNLDAFDFFRIEGHLGISATNAISQLNQKLAVYGLNMNISVFDIDQDKTELQVFINKNNSLEHVAGVSKGGTFLILKKADTILADFAMNYKYQAQDSEICCKISECVYPWISSLKYLNNLSRSLKGTQSRTTLMPKNYRLLITRYTINDIELISQPVEINIPLTDVFMRRMHVVTEKLNERFPTGVVFDFDQQKKQLRIKRLKEDTFNFSLKDITLKSNSPVYTYTETGFLRNSRMLLAKNVICSDVKIHHSTIYQNLHEKYNPVNKDDDYGTYNDQWSRWNDLIVKLASNPFFTEKKQKRFITQFTELPAENQAELRTIKAEIAQLNPNAKIYLSGEWVSASWVDQSMLTYYTSNQKNTHDDIVLFIQLRNKLHQKPGKSKYAIFVNVLNEEQLRTLQNKYLNKVDFYLGRAEGETVLEF